MAPKDATAHATRWRSTAILLALRSANIHFAGTKIVVVFEEPHPTLDDHLYTKHFRVQKPGCLEWGIPIEVIEVKHRDLEESFACPWG
jgi:hypothetical protein